MEERIKELELKVMYQEKLVGELNEAVTEIRLDRDKLQKRVDKLERQVSQVLEAEPDD